MVVVETVDYGDTWGRFCVCSIKPQISQHQESPESLSLLNWSKYIKCFFFVIYIL